MLRIRVKFAGAGSYEGWTRQFLLDRSQPLDELKSTIRDHTGLPTHQQHLSKGKTILYDFQMPAQIPLYDNDVLMLQIYDAVLPPSRSLPQLSSVVQGAASVYKAPPEQEIVVINPYGIGTPAVTVTAVASPSERCCEPAPAQSIQSRAAEAPVRDVATGSQVQEHCLEQQPVEELPGHTATVQPFVWRGTGLSHCPPRIRPCDAASKSAQVHAC